MQRKAPSEHKIKALGFNVQIHPNLQISKISANSIASRFGEFKTSGEFYDVVKGLGPEQIQGVKKGKSGPRGVPPNIAKSIHRWKTEYRVNQERYEQHQEALKKAEGHERNYQNATKGIRDEIAIKAMTAMLQNSGVLGDTDLIATRSYKMADSMLEARKM